MSYIHTAYEFIITGDHPHKGEHCMLKGETKHTATVVMGMVEVFLINCSHGGIGAMVPKENLKLLPDEERIYADK